MQENIAYYYIVVLQLYAENQNTLDIIFYWLWYRYNLFYVREEPYM